MKIEIEKVEMTDHFEFVVWVAKEAGGRYFCRTWKELKELLAEKLGQEDIK